MHCPRSWPPPSLPFAFSSSSSSSSSVDEFERERFSRRRPLLSQSGSVFTPASRPTVARSFVRPSVRPSVPMMRRGNLPRPPQPQPLLLMLLSCTSKAAKAPIHKVVEIHVFFFKSVQCAEHFVVMIATPALIFFGGEDAHAASAADNLISSSTLPFLNEST